MAHVFSITVDVYGVVVYLTSLDHFDIFSITDSQPRTASIFDSEAGNFITRRLHQFAKTRDQGHEPFLYN
jgi:hypothetical protein